MEIKTIRFGMFNVFLAGIVAASGLMLGLTIYKMVAKLVIMGLIGDVFGG